MNVTNVTRLLASPAGIVRARLLARKGALFILSHSGGKDSQAQYLALLRCGIPAAQIVVIHADLGEVEHRDVKPHIRATVRPEHRDIILAYGRFKDGSDKDFIASVRQRRAKLDATGRRDKSAAPDTQNRYCTSDLKTSPIWREAKAEAKRRGLSYGILVNVVGIRAQEGGRRSKEVAARPTDQFKVASKPDNGTWRCYDYWPLAFWSVEDVWAEISHAGQQPYHGYGFDGVRATKNQRISCEFCIYGSPNDLALAARRRPDLARKLIALEVEIRGPLHISRVPLKDILNNLGTDLPGDLNVLGD